MPGEKGEKGEPGILLSQYAHLSAETQLRTDAQGQVALPFYLCSASFSPGEDSITLSQSGTYLIIYTLSAALQTKASFHLRAAGRKIDGSETTLYRGYAVNQCVIRVLERATLSLHCDTANLDHPGRCAVSILLLCPHTD